MDSSEFFSQYSQGNISDDEDLVEWACCYQQYLTSVRVRHGDQIPLGEGFRVRARVQVEGRFLKIAVLDLSRTQVT